MKKLDPSNVVPPKKGGKSVFGKIVAWIHLWPSLISALILIFVCLTGTIIVYCDEIIDFANRDVLHVKEIKEQKVPVALLLENYKKAFPKLKPPGYMVFYRDPSRTVKLNIFDPQNGLRFVYMDPYTGKVIKTDGTIHFFFVTAHLHSMLLWPHIGEWIIDIATVIFLIELITGLILWWPAKWTKTTRDQSFKIKWKGTIKRVNYDLHNVLGFYSLAIVTVLTVTGLIIAFRPLASFTVDSLGGNSKTNFEKSLPGFKPQRQPFELNTVIKRYFTQEPWSNEAKAYTFKMDSAGYVMLVYARHMGLKSQDGNFTVYVDRFSGSEIKAPSEIVANENIENGYWSLHMGTWLGPVGKLLTFIGGIIATSLPVTGFFIWWNRRKKKKLRPAAGDNSGQPAAPYRPGFLKNKIGTTTP